MIGRLPHNEQDYHWVPLGRFLSSLEWKVKPASLDAASLEAGDNNSEVTKKRAHTCKLPDADSHVGRE
jgi:hypothetical protein